MMQRRPQGIASAFHTTLDVEDCATTYSRLEQDETGEYAAQYEVTSAVGATGSDSATHSVQKTVVPDDFVRFADARATVDQLEVHKTSTVDVNAGTGVITEARVTLTSATRQRESSLKQEGDYELKAEHMPRTSVQGSLRLVRTSVDDVRSFDVSPARDAEPAAVGNGHHHPRRLSMRSSSVGTDADEQDSVELFRHGLMTTGHEDTYTFDGDLVSTSVNEDDATPLAVLLSCLANPVMNHGAAPRGFSFEGTQVRAGEGCCPSLPVSGAHCSWLGAHVAMGARVCVSAFVLCCVGVGLGGVCAKQHTNNTRAGSRGECAMRLVREARRRPKIVTVLANTLAVDALQLDHTIRQVFVDVLASVGTPAAQDGLAAVVSDEAVHPFLDEDEFVAMLVSLYHVQRPTQRLLDAVVQLLPVVQGKEHSQALMTIGRLGSQAAAAGAPDVARSALEALEAEAEDVVAADALHTSRRRALLGAAAEHWESLGEQGQRSWMHSVHGWRPFEGVEVWEHATAVERGVFVNRTLLAIAHELDAAGLSVDHHTRGRVLAEGAAVREWASRPSANNRRRGHTADDLHMPFGGSLPRQTLEEQVGRPAWWFVVVVVPCVCVCSSCCVCRACTTSLWEWWWVLCWVWHSLPCPRCLFCSLPACCVPTGPHRHRTGACAVCVRQLEARHPAAAVAGIRR